MLFYIELMLKKYKELYDHFIKLLKETKLVFSYLSMDELYTFIGKKEIRAYVWTAVGVTKRGRKFCFYHLSFH